MAAGTGTGWHDHGESAGAFLTLADLRQDRPIWSPPPAPNPSPAAKAGPSHPTTFTTVFNVGVQTAFSVHLYTLGSQP